MLITLQTCDGNGVDVDTRVARSSSLICNMLDDLGEIEGQIIPLSGIDDVGILKKGQFTSTFTPHQLRVRVRVMLIDFHS